MFLSQKQIDFFRNVGYLKLSDKFSDIIVKLLTELIYKDISERVQPFQTNDKGRLQKLSALIERNSIFQETFSSDIILNPLESLLGPNIEFTKNRHNHATVNFKGAVRRRLHRDILQWSRGLITVIIFLEESTIENGCTEIIPCSQYFQFIGKPNNGGTWMDEHKIYEDLIGQSLPIPMPEGGILLIDGLAFHTVGENQTNETRMSITLGYRSVDELNSAINNSDSLLVRGERVYKGNDLNYKS